VARLESLVEALLAAGGQASRSLRALVDAFEARVGEAIDSGAVALKSVLAYRAGLRLPSSSQAQLRRAFTDLDRAAQARRFDDPVLEPFLVGRAAELAAKREVPLQFHTGLGDADIDLPRADPALLRPLLTDPRTEACQVVLLHCYPFAGAAAYLAGLYPQVHLDLSLAIPLAEPIAERLLREALALCPASKLLAASDGHSFPEMHWWGAIVWRRALGRVLTAEMRSGGLDAPAAMGLAERVLGGNASALYHLVL
jgi:predicted TIM-barrel fold metal-dependent hydrolase